MAHGIGATIRFTARTTARGSRSTARWFLRSTRAEGAGQSGLANLIDLHSINAAADALLTVALANTLFFSVDVNQARSRVAIYLLVSGSTWEGIGLIGWGIVVIGLVDNILRPLLVGKDTKLPDYLVLVSTLGGMALFGLTGFVIGPAIAALFVAAWDLFSPEQ